MTTPLSNALTVSVLRNADLGDCTNGGISARRNRLHVLCPDGPARVEPDAPATIKLVRHAGIIVARPAHLPAAVRPMFGGNYLTSSDGRLARHAFRIWIGSNDPDGPSAGVLLAEAANRVGCDAEFSL